MNTITNEQIIQAFERPELLRELYPHVFKPVLEAGKWYIITLGKLKTLFNFSGNFDEKGNPIGYGFGYYIKKWINDAKRWFYDTIRPATAEEVETALIAEAKKRGFGKGVKITGISIDWLFKIHGDYFQFYEEANILTIGGILIFENGKWAEITQETEIELTLDEIAEKFGVDKVKIKK